MLKSPVLLGVVLAAIPVLGSAGLPSAAAPPPEEVGGLIDSWAKNADGETSVGGTQHRDGSADGHEETADGSKSGATQLIDYTPQEPPTPEECRANWDAMISCWEHVNPPEPGEDPEESTPAIPEITMTDLATFSPDPGTLTGEPDNLGVTGLPTNFTTDADTHTQAGELFGFPIQVRFTPDTFTFHYGDSESRASDTAGASWDDLAQAQFTPTDTSHAYAERGTYDARVDVAYTAEIDLGVGWFPITGQLTIPGTPQPIRIYEAHTALVAHTCDELPTAPGC